MILVVLTMVSCKGKRNEKNHTPKVSPIRKSATFLSKKRHRFSFDPWITQNLNRFFPMSWYVWNSHFMTDLYEEMSWKLGIHWLHTRKSRSVVVKSWSLHWGFPILWGRCMIRLFSLEIFIISMIVLDLTIGAHMKSVSKKKWFHFRSQLLYFFSPSLVASYDLF